MTWKWMVAWGKLSRSFPISCIAEVAPISGTSCVKWKRPLFEQGVALSRHAIHSAGRLAPLFLRAANGLVVMRALDGWPGVMGESHLSAVADLLDDPVPMLAPLLDLPLTLLMVLLIPATGG